MTRIRPMCRCGHVKTPHCGSTSSISPPHNIHIKSTSSTSPPHNIHIKSTSSTSPSHFQYGYVDIPLHIHISSIFAMWPRRSTLLSLINIVTVIFSSKGFRRLVRNNFSLIPEIKILIYKIFAHPKEEVLTL